MPSTTIDTKHIASLPAQFEEFKKSFPDASLEKQIKMITDLNTLIDSPTTADNIKQAAIQLRMSLDLSVLPYDYKKNQIDYYQSFERRQPPRVRETYLAHDFRSFQNTVMPQHDFSNFTDTVPPGTIPDASFVRAMTIGGFFSRIEEKDFPLIRSIKGNVTLHSLDILYNGAKSKTDSSENKEICYKMLLKVSRQGAYLRRLVASQKIMALFPEPPTSEPASSEYKEVKATLSHPKFELHRQALQLLEKKPQEAAKIFGEIAKTYKEESKKCVGAKEAETKKYLSDCATEALYFEAHAYLSALSATSGCSFLLYALNAFYEAFNMSVYGNDEIIIREQMQRLKQDAKDQKNECAYALIDVRLSQLGKTALSKDELEKNNEVVENYFHAGSSDSEEDMPGLEPVTPVAATVTSDAKLPDIQEENTPDVQSPTPVAAAVTAESIPASEERSAKTAEQAPSVTTATINPAPATEAKKAETETNPSCWAALFQCLTRRPKKTGEEKASNLKIQP